LKKNGHLSLIDQGARRSIRPRSKYAIDWFICEVRLVSNNCFHTNTFTGDVVWLTKSKNRIFALFLGASLREELIYRNLTHIV
jgi:hypothetical protein